MPQSYTPRDAGFLLANAMLARRKLLRLTQAEVARRCGQKVDWYGLRERCGRKILAVDLLAVAAALECSPGALLAHLVPAEERATP